MTMKTLICFIIIVASFRLHTQTPEPEPEKRYNKAQIAGYVLFSAGFCLVANATNLTPLFPMYLPNAPVFYFIGLGVMLTGSVILLLSHRKKNEQSVWSDLYLPAYTGPGNVISQPSHKKLLGHIDK
jgi:hypothetical protein